jgi:hypothetical protein
MSAAPSSTLADLREQVQDLIANKTDWRDENECPCCLEMLRIDVSSQLIENVIDVLFPDLRSAFDKKCGEVAAARRQELYYRADECA